MKLSEKRFPKFDASSSFEAYAEKGGTVEQNRNGQSSRNAIEAEAGCTAQAQRTYEEALDAVITCVGAQNSLREILYKTLAFCKAPREFTDVEDFIAKSDEAVYSHVIQTPFELIGMLVRAGGLDEIPLDGKGGEISPETLDALSLDEQDDLIATYRIETTEAGAAAVELLSPARRIEAQLAKDPHRADTFWALIEFCKTPRTFPQIKEYFDATPEFAHDVVAHSHQLAPDFYVDKLDKAGALVWRGAWVATDAGKTLLEAHKAQV